MFATACAWLLTRLRHRTGDALHIAREKRRLELLLRAEGVSKATAVRVAAAFFAKRAPDERQ